MKRTWIASRSAEHVTYSDNIHHRPGGNVFISHPLGNLVSWISILIGLTAAIGSVSAEESESRTVSEGDLITYYYNVSNIGNVNLTGIKVIDDKSIPSTFLATSITIAGSTSARSGFIKQFIGSPNPISIKISSISQMSPPQILVETRLRMEI